MSASLVGSEMCIRDRIRAGLPLRPVPGQQMQFAGPAVTLGDAMRPGNQTVSYTHLTLPTICSV
eukprot:14396338-Alexandrium_andersonii.AAC.1